MMNNIREQKCPCCGAPLRFAPNRGKLVCDYCSSEFAIEPNRKDLDGNRMEGFDFEKMLRKNTAPKSDSLPVCVCKSCGAELMVAAEEFSLTCPYCGNAIVLTEKASGGLRPDGVIPFSVLPDGLPEAVTKYYRNKFLLPRRFFSESRMGKVTGVYVPFWVFSGKVSGTVRYYGEKDAGSHREGDYICTEYREYSLTREVSAEFKDVPVDASGRISDALMDSLEPFDMADVKPYDPAYLAGFTADRFDDVPSGLAERARERMVNTAASAASDKAAAGYSSVRCTGSRLSAELTADYLLFPVYLFSVEYEGKKYDFAVNGQTGRVVGDLPVDQSVKKSFFIKAALASGGLLFLLRYLLYFFIK